MYVVTSTNEASPEYNGASASAKAAAKSSTFCAALGAESLEKVSGATDLKMSMTLTLGTLRSSGMMIRDGKA